MEGFDFLREVLDKTPPPHEPLFRTMRVVQSGIGSTYATPLRGDQSIKVGPLLGATKPIASDFGIHHTHAVIAIPVGALVLVVTTVDGPWMVREDLDTFLPPSGARPYAGPPD